MDFDDLMSRLRRFTTEERAALERWTESCRMTGIPKEEPLELPDPLEVDDIPVVKPQIVVSSQIVPDQSLVVLLTKTFGALGANDDSDP